MSYNREKEALAAISYLHQEGFLECFLDKDGTPCVRLTVELDEAKKTISELAKKINKTTDTADWWKKS
jgi:CRISPR/Cas system-associated endonuclease Cas1